MRIVVLSFVFLIALMQSASSGLADKTIDSVVSGLKEPWSIGFLPDRSVLITEKRGNLFRVAPNGTKRKIRGVPRVAVKGQGGLLDVLVPRNFASSGQIFLSYATVGKGGFVTAIASADLDLERNTLKNVRQIFAANSGSTGGRHFGGRLVEAPDGSLFLTIGDRGERNSAQNPSEHHGSVVRITKDGRPVQGGGQNGWLADVWTKGHRNAQGAALDSNGQLWVVEHGPKGGDEINRVKAGNNYGWPVIGYGVHYSGGKVGEGTHKEGLQQPNLYWDPSIAPSGMMIYSGKMFPEWRGDFFIGSLKFDMISRVERNGNLLTEVERLASRETGRVRDIREAPDGSIWFLSVDRGALFRIIPRLLQNPNVAM
jgi:glucose/arabinose dehydrogenase